VIELNPKKLTFDRRAGEATFDAVIDRPTALGQSRAVLAWAKRGIRSDRCSIDHNASRSGRMLSNGS
jgi:hypothetical protein